MCNLKIFNIQMSHLNAFIFKLLNTRKKLAVWFLVVKSRFYKITFFYYVVIYLLRIAIDLSNFSLKKNSTQ